MTQQQVLDKRMQLMDINIQSKICEYIGCSGIDPKLCPGDPNCSILKKITCNEDEIY